MLPAARSESDPEHCSSCGNACAEGDLCAAGSCCTPTGPETCDGDDDDCDGLVDEGRGHDHRMRGGRDLRRQADGNTSISACEAAYPKFLSNSPGDSTTELASDFECVARLGSSGCGFEQQLEASLKALRPSTSPITFFSGTRRHGDGANDGFLCTDSLLGVVMVTDEDDCSASPSAS